MYPFGVTVVELSSLPGNAAFTRWAAAERGRPRGRSAVAVRRWRTRLGWQHLSLGSLWLELVGVRALACAVRVAGSPHLHTMHRLSHWKDAQMAHDDGDRGGRRRNGGGGRAGTGHGEAFDAGSMCRGASVGLRRVVGTLLRPFRGNRPMTARACGTTKGHRRRRREGACARQAEQRTVRENPRHQPERTRAFASRVSVMGRPLRSAWLAAADQGRNGESSRGGRAGGRAIMGAWKPTTLPRTTTPGQRERRKPVSAADAAAFLGRPAAGRGRGRRRPTTSAPM